MKRISVFVLAFFVLVQDASAQLVGDPAYYNMQRSIVGVMNNVAQDQGFNLNDPRVYGTMYGVGKAAATTAAGAGAALLVGGTAPAWGTVLAVAAISGAVSYAIPLGIDSLVKWTFGAPAATPISYTAPAVVVGQTTITPSVSAPPMATVVANSINIPYYIITTDGTYWYNQSWESTTAYTNPQPGVMTLSQNFTLNGVNYYVWNSTAVRTSVLACPTGFSVSGSVCTNNNTGGSPVTTALQTMTQAINALTTAQRATQLNQQTLALVLNYLWQQAAAQPGYSGIPYNSNNAIGAEIANFYASNPASTPTVGALAVPVSNPQTDFMPAASPTGALVPDTSATSPATVDAASSVAISVDLGADPGIGNPTLETPPDGPTIMAPLVTGLAPYLSFSVVMPTGTCPSLTFDFRPVWNKVITDNTTCTLYDSLYSKIYAAATLAWSMLFVIIVLTA